MIENSRTYEYIYPQHGTITVASTKEIKEIGIYVALLEFNEAQGMLLISELSRRRFRSVNKLIKIGKREIVAVIRVNKEKGYIDVSKRQIIEDEIFCMEKKWNFSKLVNSINFHVVKSRRLNCEDSRIRWIWPMYRKFKHAVCVFKKILRKERDFLNGFDISKLEFEKFIEIIKKKIPLSFQKIEVLFELTCFNEKGVSDIRDSLNKGVIREKKNPLEVNLVVPPLFRITFKTKSKRKGLKLILITLEKVWQEIRNKKGNLCVKNVIIG